MPRNREERKALLYRLLRKIAPLLASERPDELPHVTRILNHFAPCRHSADFASVSWNGKLYSFSAAQAKIVSLLWEAMEAGTPEVRQDYLLTEATSQDSRGRLQGVFQLRDAKGERSLHPAWGEMIVPGTTRGTFRLKEIACLTEI